MAVFLVACVAALVVGCAQLGQPAPHTFKERLATGYTTVAGVRDAATNLLGANKISVQDASNIQAQADAVRTGLDIARNLDATGQVAPAGDKLSATLTALGAIQAYLIARQGGQ